MNSTTVKACAIASALLGMASAAQAAQVIVTVNGSANPYLAGQPDGTPCCYLDSAPAQSPVLALSDFAAGSIITFSAVGGFDNNGYTSGTASADGSATLTNMVASDLGIAGAQGVRTNGLVGVFLGDGVNSGAAPATRSDGMSFAALAPELYQIFWIGDGLTGTGTGMGDVQQFTAPDGATRLFLGAVDGWGWANNTGVSTVTINYTPASTTPGTTTPGVPEPATWGLMIAGFGLMGGMLRRRKPHATPATV